MMTRDEAIQKAIKLLRLSESSNVNEAALAATRAQEILDRFEIDKAALELSGAEPETPDEEIEDFSSKGAYLDDEESSRYPRWKLSLAGSVARANACQVYLRHVGYHRGTSAWKSTATHKMGIVGRPSDVEKVRYLFAYLVNETNRLTDRDGKGCGKTWRNNYRLGVVDTLRNALYDSAKRAADSAREDVGTNEQALMIVERAIAKREERSKSVAVWMKKNMKLHSIGGSASGYDHGAREQGRRAGREIHINSARGALGGRGA